MRNDECKMKITVNVRRFQIDEEKIAGQIRAISRICDEIAEIEEVVAGMSYMDEVLAFLCRTKEALEDHIRVMRMMKNVLQEAESKYIKVENQIVDQYNLDVVIYPRTNFGKSKIEGMRAFQSLLLF